jgi:hypothetical protein
MYSDFTRIVFRGSFSNSDSMTSSDMMRMYYQLVCMYKPVTVAERSKA